LKVICIKEINKEIKLKSKVCVQIKPRKKTRNFPKALGKPFLKS
jgi:hypothetical protein